MSEVKREHKAGFRNKIISNNLHVLQNIVFRFKRNIYGMNVNDTTF